MARTRGEANRALYRARILLDGWDRMRAECAHSEQALLGAFLPAVRLHLIEAYGWFLLAISGVEDSLAPDLPRSTRDLSEPEAGRAQIPEIAEFAQLESAGWLAELLAKNAEESPGHAVAASSHKSQQGLLVTDRQPPGYAVAFSWADALAAIMTRMDDSISEY